MTSIYRPLCQGLLLALAIGCSAPAMAQSQRIGPDYLAHQWILLNTQVQMTTPNSGLNLNKPDCVAVTYTVGSNGVPMNVKVAKMVPQSGLGPAAASAVSNFRYGPSLANRDSNPVDTYYVVAFNSPEDKAKRQALIDACKLPGYGQ